MSVFGSSAMLSEYQSAFRASDITSYRMRAAINDWFDLYFHKESTEESDPCQNIPYTIVNKLTKTVFSEYSVDSKDDFVSGVIRAMNDVKEDAMQMALIGGYCGLKPIPDSGRFRFSVVSRDNILVFGRDAYGSMTDIGTLERTVSGKYYYTLLERRTLDGRGYLTIQNMLYRSDNSALLGSRVRLQELDRYADFEDTFTFPQPVWSVGVIGMKTPIANCVDGGPDGVSVYASAAGLIHNINRNEAQINGEFERGESRIIVSADMMEVGDDGKRRKIKSHVFTSVDEDPDTVGVTIFSPALREQSFLNRKREYLRNVESVIGLKRGLLSEVEAAERTATEVTSSEGDYNLTIIEFQQMWENAVAEAVRLCGIFGQMYKIPGAHEAADDAYTVDWGNGVLFDEEKTWADYKDMVASGLLKPEIALGWRFNMPTDTEAQRRKIREKYMPDAAEDDE